MEGMNLPTAVAAVVGAVAGLVAAVASLWNAHQLSVLKGRVDEVSQNLTAHLGTPGLHR